MTSLADPALGPVETPVLDAACLILVDRSSELPRLLMGRRLPTQVFLPNKWVFPGGRVDDADREFSRVAAASHGLAPSKAAHLSFAFAAVRETFEETGILAAAATHAAAPQPCPLTAFSDSALTSTMDLLKPLARAITPPGLPRRFDTWFYLADWDRARDPHGTPDGELLDIGWFTLPEALGLDLPIITRLIVDDVATMITTTPGHDVWRIPFYYQAVEGYRRTLIDAEWPWPNPGAEAQPMP